MVSTVTVPEAPPAGFTILLPDVTMPLVSPSRLIVTVSAEKLLLPSIPDAVPVIE